MSYVTDDPKDPRLTRGYDDSPRSQADAYLILPRSKRQNDDFVRPYRTTYIHITCGRQTTMGKELSETYAADPTFYGATYCTECRMHRPVGEFKWLDGSTVGS